MLHDPSAAATIENWKASIKFLRAANTTCLIGNIGQALNKQMSKYISSESIHWYMCKKTPNNPNPTKNPHKKPQRWKTKPFLFWALSLS